MKGTIKSKEDIERLFRKGRRSSSYVMIVLAYPTGEDGSASGSCAFIAGKKLGSAPFRNRCKRVLRATARELGAPWTGFNVAFVARQQLAHAHHDKVLFSMRRQLKELGIESDG